jgi:hypothetical protein
MAKFRMKKRNKLTLEKIFAVIILLLFLGYIGFIFVAFFPFLG